MDWDDITELQYIWLLCDSSSAGCYLIALIYLCALQNKRRYIYLIFQG